MKLASIIMRRQRVAIAALSLIAGAAVPFYVNSQPVTKEQIENSKRAVDGAAKDAGQRRARESTSGIPASNHPPLSKEQIARAKANLGGSNSKEVDLHIRRDIIAKHLSYCMAPKAQFGQYSSFDGGKSAVKLTLECQKEMMEYMDNCKEAGRTIDDCLWELGIFAQVTIKMFGK